MFSETRYALNGDLRVAYRTSREGPRDIVCVPNWVTCCEVLPELPSLQGWVEAMTSLGRLTSLTSRARERPILSRPVHCRRWSNGPTASPRAHDLGSGEAVLVASDAASATAALFAATHPSRTTDGPWAGVTGCRRHVRAFQAAHAVIRSSAPGCELSVTTTVPLPVSNVVLA